MLLDTCLVLLAYNIGWPIICVGGQFGGLADDASKKALYIINLGADYGGDGGIRTLDTPLERITV